jgi:molybdopterin synthase sulfur carrier subunit
MNTYQIHYLGLLANRRGAPSETIIRETNTPADLYRELCDAYPLGLTMRDVRVAVNDEFAPWDQPLENGDRIAFLPPMSGG